MAGTRRLRSNRLALPILLRVPMQPVKHRAKRAGTCRCWVSLGYGNWVAIASRFDSVAPGRNRDEGVAHIFRCRTWCWRYLRAHPSKEPGATYHRVTWPVRHGVWRTARDMDSRKEA